MKLTLVAVVALLPPGALAQSTFTNKPALQAAVDLWCSDEPAALAAYGNISDWDVSAITDMKCCSTVGGAHKTRRFPGAPAP